MHLLIPSLRRFAPYFILFPALFLFWHLNYASFWNPDEGRYAAAAREMAFGLDGHGPDWLVPHLNTITRLNKPPLVYWLTGASFRLLGLSELSGRIVPALASLTVLLVLFQWGRVAFGLRAGLTAGMMWATAIFPFAMARTLNTDMLLTASITLALWGWSGHHRSAKAILISGLGLGLALLAKGPVGLAMPLGIFLAFSIVTRKPSLTPAFRTPAKAILGAVLLGCCIGLPWFIAVQSRRLDFLHNFLFAENLGRFSGSKEFHEKTPVWFYLPIIFAGLMPWTFFALGAFTRWTSDENENRTRLFLWMWAGLVIGVFSISSTKLISYVLPAFPALALLAGTALSRWEGWPVKLRRFAVGTTLVVNCIILLVLFAVPRKANKQLVWKPGILRDEKILPRPLGEKYLVGIVVAVVFGSGALVFASRNDRAWSVVGAIGISAGALYVAVAPLAGEISKYRDASTLFVQLQPVLKPDDQILTYRVFPPTGIFYTGRPLTCFSFKNSSGLDEQELAASPWFHQTGEVTQPQFSHPAGRVFWITKGPDKNPNGVKLEFWGRNNDFYLYSNRPKPSDFHLDLVSPVQK